MSGEPRTRQGGDDRGGGAGTVPLTPQAVANRPGLDALACRVGTHSSFLETMKARLSSTADPALHGLRTRDASDPAIALLDAWAMVADVLTFYQERIANEGYLRTATERRSVLELARLVGYDLRPGVASSVHLAFTIEEKPRPVVAPGSPVAPASASLEEPETLIPAGARVQSVPGPGEQPQPFETGEDLAARAAWNNLAVRLTRPQLPDGLILAREQPAVYLRGTATRLQPNDPLLVDAGPGAASGLYRVTAVLPDAARDRTRAEVEPWWRPPALPRVLPEPIAAPHVPPLRQWLRRHRDELERRLDFAGARGEGRPPRREERWDAPRRGPARDSLGRELASARRAAGQAPSAPGSTTQLGAVLESLGKSPQVPPRGHLQLRRDVRQLFTSGSDFFARLLAVLRPELRGVLYTAWANVPVTPAPRLQAYGFRTRASVFGANAPLELRRDSDGAILGTQEWGLEVSGPSPEETDVLWLDASYPQILPGSWIVLERPTPLAPAVDGSPLVIARVVAVNQRSRAAYGISAKSTRIELDLPWLAGGDTFAVIRGTAVYAESAPLPLAEEPIDPVAEPVRGQEIELAGLYDGLTPGRRLIVCGERTDVGGLDPRGQVTVPVAGVAATELAMLAAVSQGVAQRRAGGEAADRPGERTHTTLILAAPLSYCYKRDTVTVYGNVADATHGETRRELLGSGDGSQPLQRFTLRQPPLTWVSRPTRSGVESTLEVRVNDLLWHEAESLAALGPTDRGYVTATDDSGATTVTFGNGEHGARLPTGAANVQAAYRSRLGTAGNVKAGQISQLATRPLGVKAVINPLPASGGADPESRDQARRNAPLAVVALDRLVSVQDYADCARTFAGIGKASAARLTKGRVQLVHVTIAGEDDLPIPESSDLFQNVAAALRQLGDSRQPVQLASSERRLLIVSAEIEVLPGYAFETVAPRVRAALLDAFGYARRDLGQDAVLSEAYRTIHGVGGVASTDLRIFDAVTGGIDPTDLARRLEELARGPRTRVRAHPDRVNGRGILHAAQVVYLSPEPPDTLIVEERAS